MDPRPSGAAAGADHRRLKVFSGQVLRPHLPRQRVAERVNDFETPFVVRSASERVCD
jgi:hypothetical protein